MLKKWWSEGRDDHRKALKEEYDNLGVTGDSSQNPIETRETYISKRKAVPAGVEAPHQGRNNYLKETGYHSRQHFII